MANSERRFRRYLARRGPGTWPCPSCGFRTLEEGPGDFDLCPVCLWEDDGAQLRWPTLEDGPNGISLIEAQRNFAALGACDADSVDRVRKPKPGEEREPEWRPVDPARDDFESGPDDPTSLPWPESSEELYWWRPTYYRRPENRRPGLAPRQPPSNEAERLMARIIEVAPETESLDQRMRSTWEAPAPFAFCGELGTLVVELVRQGNTEAALRIVTELNAGVMSEDPATANSVCIGFLESLHALAGESEFGGVSTGELADFVDLWPPEIKAELHRQEAHMVRARRGVERWWVPGPEGSYRPTKRWKLRHPILWWKMRHGGIHLTG